jgi:hypothetical protein
MSQNTRQYATTRSFRSNCCFLGPLVFRNGMACVHRYWARTVTTLPVDTYASFICVHIWWHVACPSHGESGPPVGQLPMAHFLLELAQAAFRAERRSSEDRESW